MRTSGILCAILITLPIMAAENDSKAMFAKHWRVAKEFTLAVAKAMPARHTPSSPPRKR
jgi:hypothetical protein